MKKNTASGSSAEISFKRWSRQEYTQIKPGLERITKFFKIISCEKIISSEKDGLLTIHIAGTNGKGSVASYIASILKEAGLKTGLYTSPHLVSLSERIKLNGKNIPPREIEKFFKTFAPRIRSSGMTFFETMTALAIIYFYRHNIDVAVMEVGVGGRYDATNICQNKALSVITSISKDHTDLFGNNIRNIAREDIGIIKNDVPVVAGKLNKLPGKIVSCNACSKNSPAYFYGKNFISGNIRSDWKNLCQSFDYIEKKSDGKPAGFKLRNLKIRLMGNYQARNAAIAVKSALILKNNRTEFSKNITTSAIKRGLLKTRWSARFEVHRLRLGGETKYLIIDGAHNEEAVSNFVSEYLKSPFYRMKTRIIFSSLKEKNHRAMAKLLSTIADEVIITKVNSPRAQEPSVIKSAFIKASQKSKRLLKENIHISYDIKSILKAGNTATVTVAIGSLYLAGEILKLIKRGNHYGL